MKRSRINEVIKDMEALIKEHGFEIPPFAKWSAKDWENVGHDYPQRKPEPTGKISQNLCRETTHALCGADGSDAFPLV